MVASARDRRAIHGADGRTAGRVRVTIPLAALTVAAGGALGAVLRWGVTVATARLLARGGAGHLPLGTLIVNVVGCLLLAWLVAAGQRNDAGSGLRLFLGTGVLGALTTFGLDAHGLVVQGRGGTAALYVGGTLVLAGVAVVAGWALGRAG